MSFESCPFICRKYPVLSDVVPLLLVSDYEVALEFVALVKNRVKLTNEETGSTYVWKEDLKLWITRKFPSIVIEVYPLLIDKIRM